MTRQDSPPLELTEYDPVLLERDLLPMEAGELLWRRFGTQVSVEFPSPKTESKWRLTSEGWVGHIPLTEGLTLALRPKVPLANLFRMWEYAYRLRSFRFLEGLTNVRSLEEFFDQLANVLARRVLDRGRKGFYRAYIHKEELLPFVRGRLDLRRALQRPWELHLKCEFDEHTPDIDDNQILLWTLWRIARTGLCSDRVLPSIRRAYRGLQGLATLSPQSPRACVGRSYNRLNDDYEPLHALCRFFLESTGPTYEAGSHAMLPFLVDMARLYELFVAEWLKAHLPPDTLLKYQERIDIGPGGALYFAIDIVFCDSEGIPRCIVDTKYKTSTLPASDDLAQVVAYAEATSCREAVLIYPTASIAPFNERIGDIHVRTLTFAIGGDLEEAGLALLADLVPVTTTAPD